MIKYSIDLHKEKACLFAGKEKGKSKSLKWAVDWLGKTEETKIVIKLRENQLITQCFLLGMLGVGVLNTCNVELIGGVPQCQEELHRAKARAHYAKEEPKND